MMKALATLDYGCNPKATQRQMEPRAGSGISDGLASTQEGRSNICMVTMGTSIPKDIETSGVIPLFKMHCAQWGGMH